MIPLVFDYNVILELSFKCINPILTRYLKIYWMDMKNYMIKMIYIDEKF